MDYWHACASGLRLGQPVLLNMTQAPIPALSHLQHLGGAFTYLEEIHQVLNALTLFEGFSASDHATLCEYMECYAAPSHTPIVTEGTEGDFVVIILTGGVNVIKTDAHAAPKVVAHVGPGGFLGEMSLVDGQQRFASCIATQPTDLAVLTRDDLTGILDDHPQLGNKILLLLLQLVTKRLRDSTTRMLPTIGAQWV